MSQRGKKILRNLAKCKAKGKCDRDKLATRYLAARVSTYERKMETVNELYRAANTLPPCPPVCPEPKLIEGEINHV